MPMLIDPLRRVHNSVYSAATFVEEQTRLFARVWNFVAHESELAQAGSYLTCEIAGSPLIIVRDADNRLHGFYNTCRHRGCAVVSEARGQGKVFLCPYHFWEYSLDGRLIGVPGVDAYDGSGFRMEDFGLAPVRVESLYGLVFACLDPNAPTLSDYLGEDLVERLRLPIGGQPFEIFRQRSTPMHANWKCFAENGRDGYHVKFVHPFLRKSSPPKEFRLLNNGHALQRVAYLKEAVGEEAWEETTAHPLPGLERGCGWVVVVFPDLLLMPRVNHLQILSQRAISAEESILELRALAPAGDSEQQRVARVKGWELWAAGQLPEDMAVIEQQQRGLTGRGVEWSLIARGADAGAGVQGDDNKLRQFWSVWRRYMGCDENAWPGVGAGSLGAAAQ